MELACKYLCRLINLKQLKLAINIHSDNEANNLSDLLLNLLQLEELDLNLSHSKITETSVKLIGHSLSKLKNISILSYYLSACKINDDVSECLVEELAHFIKLKQLSLNLRENNIAEKGAIQISKVLSKMT